VWALQESLDQPVARSDYPLSYLVDRYHPAVGVVLGRLG
jgi:hypothetical protein